MNLHDSGLIENGLLKNGFHKADSVSDAGIVILNTCSVRDHADHKILSELGRLKKTCPDKKIVLAGCFAKQIKLKTESEKRKSEIGHFFDYCFGPDEIPSIPDVLKRKNAFVKDNKDFVKPQNDAATVKITEGCNNFCSYCIVPYVRGEERSIPFEIIYNTVKEQVSKGVKEILLLGQNVNSYLSPEDGNKDFVFLLNALSEIKGAFKIKFLTSHPKDFNDGLIETVCKNGKISKEIHLPVQSGSDKILSAMNRGYTIKDYLNLVEKLRNGYSDISVSTDIIVGFPGETEEDFQMTVSLMEEVKFDFIFGFKYSPRPFTKSFEIPDDISMGIKKERLETVFQKQKEISKKGGSQ